MFNEQLSSLCLRWLSDSVFSVREAAATNLKNLTEVFGPEWAASTILPELSATASHASFLRRMTALITVQVLGTVVTPEILNLQLVALITKLAQDPVPNIRFNAAKTLQKLIPRIDAGVVTAQVKPALGAMCEDPDEDVRYYAAKALAMCEDPDEDVR